MDHDQLFKDLLTTFFAEFLELFFPKMAAELDRPLIQADDTYSLALFDVPILSFQFQAIQLNRLNWRDFLKKPNPVASALMAKMKIEPEDRPRAKLECLRMMLTLKYDPARSGLISQFMDSYLKLTPAETIVYTEAAEVLSPSEKEIAMTFTNEWTEKGGRETGLRIVMRLLRKRFGELPEQITSRLNELPGDRLSELAEALLDFQTLNDAQVWLSNQTV